MIPVVHSRGEYGEKLKPHSQIKCAVGCADRCSKHDRVGNDTDSSSIAVDASKLYMVGQLKDASHDTDFISLQNGQISPDDYVVPLRKCLRMKDLHEGRSLHAQIVRGGMGVDVFIWNNVVDMYAKCGSIEDARRVFDRMPKHNVFSWTVIISAYVNQGFGEEALKLFHRMQLVGMVPDMFVFATVLQACATLAILEHGRNVHIEMINSGTKIDIFVLSTLIDMYTKCGSIDDAIRTFNKMCERSVVSWNVIISGCVEQGFPEKAVELFAAMHQEATVPDIVTFVSMLKACSSMGVLEKGKQLHMHIFKSTFHSDVSIANTLIDMYAKCGSIDDSWHVFSSMTERDVVSWNVIIAGYVQHSLVDTAISLYQQMKLEAVKPNEVTFVSILKACANLGALERGKQFHEQIIKGGFEMNIFVGSTLVDMFCKCGKLNDAYHVFDNMNERNVVSWTAMIEGYAQQGLGEKAFMLYEQMELHGVTPNQATFISILKACTSLSALEMGKRIHDQIRNSKLEMNNLLVNSLVEMYAKCGSIEDALLAFNEMSERDVVIWTSMIGGYAHQGLGKEALTMFEQMQQEGVKPSAITFVSVLSACSHAGFIDEGRQYFDSMVQDHGISPTADHYACMVDLLGRGGHLEEAADLIKNMLVQPTELVWRTLLSACRSFNNEELAGHAMKQILQLNPNNDAAYVLLSNIYSANCRGMNVSR